MLLKRNFPTRKELLSLQGEFVWSFGMQFFIEVGEFECNFTWNDPDYGGDNKIEPFCGSYADWIKRHNIPFGRNKGSHNIERYCGSDVIYALGDPE